MFWVCQVFSESAIFVAARIATAKITFHDKSLVIAKFFGINPFTIWDICKAILRGFVSTSFPTTTIGTTTVINS